MASLKRWWFRNAFMAFWCLLVAAPAFAGNCDKQQSDVLQRACKAKEIENIDRTLNEQYQALLSLLKGDSVGRLKKAQNAWIIFRNSTCALEAEDIVTGESWLSGSLREFSRSECIKRMTEQRIVEINSYMDILRKNVDMGSYGSAEIHVVGIYEGPVHFGRVMEDPSASKVKIRVHAKSRPVVLLLCNYEAVLWDIDSDDGVVIKEIILSSANGAKISGIDDKAVRVTRRVMNCGYESNRIQSVAKKLKEETGLEVKSAQGLYRGTEFSIGP